MKYAVEVAQYWTYIVDADSPDEAGSWLDDDPGSMPEGECTGYNVEAVTLADGGYVQDDLRSPKPCQGGCGKSLPAAHHGRCLDCLLDRPKRAAS